MAILVRKRGGGRIRPREITDEKTYLHRREFLRSSAAVGATALAAGLLPPGAGLGREGAVNAAQKSPLAPLQARRNARFSSGEEPTSYKDATRYNNFYEFGADKTEPARYARHFVTAPWTVRIDGAVAKAGPVALEDLLKPHVLEQRVYRLRCVEAWSMVIPWVGIPLASVLKRFEPMSRAKFVEFRTLYDPERMPGQRRPILKWPYREGLRIDEAMHPLTLLAVGMYGRVLPNQNGAPLRLVVPWKYGFKSIKSIVHIRLVERQPATTWNEQAPREYGFYANVNPEVDHPRWSQKRERRIGEFRKRPTLPFNGYGEDVAGLYAGMDLRAHY